MNISNKQYILSYRSLQLDDMEEIPLSDAFLYIGKSLRIKELITADAKKVFLIGQTFCMDKKDKSPADDIKLSNANKLTDVSKNWTGRWALVTDNRLLIDATGLMSAFYYEDKAGWVVSSSLALMSEIINKPIGKKSVKSTGLTWQLLPLSLLEGVKTLFCTQIITWSKKGLAIDFCNRFSDQSSLTTMEKVNRIAMMLQNALWNIWKYSGKNISIALTAGKDSRLVLSAALASGVPFDTYTAIHPNISRSDCNLPSKMANRFGFKHRIIKPKKKNDDKYMDYLTFCGNNSKGADFTFYANGQFDEFDDNCLVIRSGIFEAAQHYGRSITTGNSIEELGKALRNYYASDIDRMQEKGLTAWIEYAKSNPITPIDIRDRFYIEQRVNGWVAAIEQSLDINSFTSIQIANCSELISILLSANEEERARLALSFDPIKKMFPTLLNYPINQRYFSDTLKIYLNGITKRIKKLTKCRQ